MPTLIERARQLVADARAREKCLALAKAVEGWKKFSRCIQKKPATGIGRWASGSSSAARSPLHHPVGGRPRGGAARRRRRARCQSDRACRRPRSPASGRGSGGMLRLVLGIRLSSIVSKSRISAPFIPTVCCGGERTRILAGGSPRMRYAAPPVQGGGWSAARRSSGARGGARCPPALALRRSTVAIAGPWLDLRLTRAASWDAALRPVPSSELLAGRLNAARRGPASPGSRLTRPARETTPASASQASAAKVELNQFVPYIAIGILGLMALTFLIALYTLLTTRDTRANRARISAADNIVKTFGGFFVGLATTLLNVG